MEKKIPLNNENSMFAGLEFFKQHLTKYHQRSLQDLKPTIFSRLGKVLPL
jgi:hypothetical protein